ncbi:hypothetical protein [Methylotenera sp.]|uniref:hypothetical protein n=1 Tax=Methylotenera sp. TaxID=2051956 RepID=UPI0024876030|nr:hypothetical protein [Methylotenera sp.]MDI1299231.1 hypothetical protein [Methylotenera sp.]
MKLSRTGAVAGDLKSKAALSFHGWWFISNSLIRHSRVGGNPVLMVVMNDG